MWWHDTLREPSTLTIHEIVDDLNSIQVSGISAQNPTFIAFFSGQKCTFKFSGFYFYLVGFSNILVPFFLLWKQVLGNCNIVPRIWNDSNFLLTNVPDALSYWLFHVVQPHSKILMGLEKSIYYKLWMLTYFQLQNLLGWPILEKVSRDLSWKIVKKSNSKMTRRHESHINFAF